MVARLDYYMRRYLTQPNNSLASLTMSSDNGIEVEALVREFKNGPRAVDGIHLRVEPGEIYGFLGRRRWHSAIIA